MTDNTDLALHMWHIVRNNKLQFAVVRDTPEEGREVLRSASGKPSSFKTWAGASRACKALNLSGFTTKDED